MRGLMNNSGLVHHLKHRVSLMRVSLFKMASSCFSSSFSKSTTKKLECKGDDEWNEAWESSWLPEEVVTKSRAPWEVDVHFDQAQNPSIVLPSQLDPDTKAFVEEMNDNWDQRRGSKKVSVDQKPTFATVSQPVMEDTLRDYRVRKQMIHAGLWMKEIEKEAEAKLIGDSVHHDIDRLLDSCSEIFDQDGGNELDCKIPSTSDFKSKPEGWETTSKPQDGNVWNLTQREEDILLQEFERRIAYTKFQIASFIKSHIFSRRRPVDGWKYMIEELGPNAKRGKGTVARLPALSDAATQPFNERKFVANRDSVPSKRRGNSSSSYHFST